MKIIYFHIPRTAGASMWHSLANSFSEVKNLGIVDTYDESLKRYGCVKHEKEILSEFLRSNEKENLLIHVHAKISFNDLNGFEYLCFGKRNFFTWRTSLITHLYIKQLHNWGADEPGKKLTCTHSDKCTKRSIPLYFIKFFYIITDSQLSWIKCLVLKTSPQEYEILRHSQAVNSQKELGVKLGRLIGADDSIQFKLKRYGSTNSNLKITGSHDSRGIQKLLGIVVNIFTMPVFLLWILIEGF
jgi:hypothetical protein